MFRNSTVCKKWTVENYLSSLILLGRGKLEDGGRYELLKQWKLYEYPEFIKFIRTYPDYWQCIKTLSNLFVVNEDLRKSASSTVHTFVEHELRRYYLLTCEHAIALAWQKHWPVDNHSLLEQRNEEFCFCELIEADEALIDDAEIHMDLYEELNEDIDTGEIYSKRVNVLRSMDRQNVVFYTKTYEFSWRAQQVFNTQSIHRYQTFYGDEFQHLLHQEAISILEKTAMFDDKSFLFPYRSTFFEAVDLSHSFNYHGYAVESSKVNDFCWALLACGQAVLTGTQRGFEGFWDDLTTHPCSTLASVVFAKPLLAFTVGRLLCDVADVSLTYLHDVAQGKRKLNKFLIPIKQHIDGLYDGQSISMYKVIEKGTEFGVRAFLEHKTLGMLSNFVDVAQRQAEITIRKHCRPQFANITVEGVVVEAFGDAALFAPETIKKNFYEAVDSGSLKSLNTKKIKNKRQRSGSSRIARLRAAFDSVTAVYHDAPYHTKKGNSRKGPRPIDGPGALKNSFPLEGNSVVRIAMNNNQFVVLEFTQERVVDGTVRQFFHGHVREWGDLDWKMKKALIKHALVKENGTMK